jgi:hypothetical protein
MRNIIGQPVAGDDLYGREHEPTASGNNSNRESIVLMLAPGKVGRHVVFRSNLLRVWWRKHHGPGDNR